MAGVDVLELYFSYIIFFPSTNSISFPMKVFHD
jgi:hypothetical protein